MNRTEQPKPFTILVGYDASECSRVAIARLADAALPETGVAYLMTVAETSDVAATLGFGSITLGPAQVQEYIRALKDSAAITAREGAESLRRVLPEWTIDTQSPEGTSYWSLIEQADRYQVDLIVLGSHGRSGLGRVMFGSTSQFVVTHANCSVRICRCGKLAELHKGRPPRIFVAIDGSPSSDAVVDAICRRRWPEGSHAHLFTAVDLGISVAIQSRAAREPGRAQLDSPAAVLASAKERLAAAGLVASSSSKIGNPKLAILEEAEQWRSDVIFIGSQGHSLIARMMLGSVSAAIAARAECSVEVVRPRKVATATNQAVASTSRLAKQDATRSKEMSCR